MNQYGLKFHHMGLALRKEDEALKFLSGLGYTTSEKIYDPEQKVNLRICEQEGFPAVELVTEQEGEDGPLTSILKKHTELIYHTCFETKDLETTLDAFEKDGIRVLPVSSPKPAVLFGGRKVSFYTVMGYGLVEILEP